MTDLVDVSQCPPLPSRFQIGDEVSVRGRKGVVVCVHFFADQVRYSVTTRRGTEDVGSGDVAGMIYSVGPPE